MLELYKQFVRPYYSEHDVAHDFGHIERMIAQLAFLDKGLALRRPDLLDFLVCFHGLGPKLREDAGFRNVTQAFLRGLEWTEPDIDDAFRSLERHLTAPVTVEEQIVHDANYIELLGVLDIAKAFRAGGARRQTYEETIDIFEKGYLNKIEFFTPVGRRMAEAGRAYVRSFLEQLRKELGQGKEYSCMPSHNINP
jgi:uncharacterized protein